MTRRASHARSIVVASAFGAATLGVAAPCFAQLAPPAPMGPNVAAASNDEARRRQQTDDLLRRGGIEDSGRPLSFFYTEAGIGLSHVGLATLSNANLGLSKTTGTGPVIDLGAGVRLLAFTLGARARLHALSNTSLWQIGADAAFHLPINPIEPYIGLHAGYAFSGAVADSAVAAGSGIPAPNASDVSLRGLGVGIEVGGDYYLSSLLSLGLDVSGDVFFLHRAAIATGAALTLPSGSSSGLGVAGTLRLGLHL